MAEGCAYIEIACYVMTSTPYKEIKKKKKPLPNRTQL